MAQRRFRRPRHPRTLGRRAIVVCEGEKTERLYFNAIRQSLRLPTLRVRVIHPEGTDPLTIVRAAVDEKLTQINDQAWVGGDLAWVVFDGDEHRFANPARWNDAIQLARGNHIQLAISNPCFELWYLLHFQAQTANLARAQARRRLDAYLGRYQKSMILWPDPLEARTNTAVARAIQLSERAGQNGLPEFSNPSTGVHKLVLSLLSLAA